jgi:hypothetical protein
MFRVDPARCVDGLLEEARNMLTQAGVTGRKPPDANMSMREFCAWAGIGKSAAYLEIRSGRLVVSYIGRKPVITAEQREAWKRALPTSVSKAA